MKKILLTWLLFILALSNISYAASSWWSAESDPFDILEAVKEKANEDYRIQETALDEVTDELWPYHKEYKIANTLDYIRQYIYPYLQWVVYIWLVVAVILIIYNWFLMVTNWVHGQWDMSKIKKNLMNIVIWVVLLTGFYFILRLMVAVITSIFGGYDWTTGFN